MSVFAGRRVAHLDGDFVVFLIGMRINRPWRPHKWLPVLTAMRPMIRELARDPDVRLPRRDTGLPRRRPRARPVLALVRGPRPLRARPRRPPSPAWRAFNQRVRDSGDVGIWHETYRVRAGEYEAIYGNMPRVGLAAVGDHRPIGTTSATAARRIGLRPDDVAAGRRATDMAFGLSSGRG